MDGAEQQFNQQLGQRVAKMRRRIGVSQHDLAEAVGISRPTLSNLESGRSGWNVYRLYLISRKLGCTVEDLFPVRPEPDREVPVTFLVTVGTKTARFQHTF